MIHQVVYGHAARNLVDSFGFGPLAASSYDRDDVRRWDARVERIRRWRDDEVDLVVVDVERTRFALRKQGGQNDHTNRSGGGRAHLLVNVPPEVRAHHLLRWAAGADWPAVTVGDALDPVDADVLLAARWPYRLAGAEVTEAVAAALHALTERPGPVHLPATDRLRVAGALTLVLPLPLDARLTVSTAPEHDWHGAPFVLHGDPGQPTRPGVPSHVVTYVDSVLAGAGDAEWQRPGPLAGVDDFALLGSALASLRSGGRLVFEDAEWVDGLVDDLCHPAVPSRRDQEGKADHLVDLLAKRPELWGRCAAEVLDTVRRRRWRDFATRLGAAAEQAVDQFATADELLASWPGRVLADHDLRGLLNRMVDRFGPEGSRAAVDLLRQEPHVDRQDADHAVLDLPADELVALARSGAGALADAAVNRMVSRRDDEALHALAHELTGAGGERWAQILTETLRRPGELTTLVDRLDALPPERFDQVLGRLLATGSRPIETAVGHWLSGLDRDRVVAVGGRWVAGHLDVEGPTGHFLVNRLLAGAPVGRPAPSAPAAHSAAAIDHVPGMDTSDAARREHELVQLRRKFFEIADDRQRWQAYAEQLELRLQKRRSRPPRPHRDPRRGRPRMPRLSPAVVLLTVWLVLMGAVGVAYVLVVAPRAFP